MSRLETASQRILPLPKAVAEELRARMERLGLHLSTWDETGRCAEGFCPSGRFCRFMLGAEAPCRQSAQDVAEKAMAQRNNIINQCRTGCFQLGVPVRRRRRIAGAVVACFPPLEILEEEHFSRMCDHLHLDRQATRNAAEKYCRHSASQAEHIISILGWLLEHLLNEQIADDELATMSTNLARTYEELSLVYRISGSIKVTQQVGDFLQNACNELLEVMNISAAWAVVHPQRQRREENMVVRAGQEKVSDEKILRLAEEINRRMDSGRRVLLDNQFPIPTAQGVEEPRRGLVAVPIVAEDRQVGLLIGAEKLSGDFNSADLQLLSSIANQTGVFLANSMLYADLQDLLIGVLHALTASIDAKDPYTSGHSQRVALISKRLAEESGLDAEKVKQVYLAGLLHDIGKIGVPEETLRKTNRLSRAEFEKIKQHPVTGAKIIGGFRQWRGVARGILTHHERPDGKGYPRQLAGEQIPIEGRIVGLADCLDAMITDRTYRKALPLEEAIEEIKSHAGTQFDPALAERLLSIDLSEFVSNIGRRSSFKIGSGAPCELEGIAGAASESEI